MRPDQRLARFIERLERHPKQLEAERTAPLNESEKAWLEAARRNERKTA